MSGCRIAIYYEPRPGESQARNPTPCGQPVTNGGLDLCEQHEADRLRMIASDLARAATNA